MLQKIGVPTLALLIATTMLIATSATAGVPRVVVAEEFGHDL